MKLDRLPTNRWIYGSNDPRETEEQALAAWQRGGITTLAQIEAHKKRQRLLLRQLANKISYLLLMLLVVVGWLVASADQHQDEQIQARTERVR